MRKEIDRYFTKYLTSIEVTEDIINDKVKSVMELDAKTINKILKKEKEMFFSSIYTFDSFFKTMPIRNGYTILTCKSIPKCIIKTLNVETIKFKDINETHLKYSLNGNGIKRWKQDNISTFEIECREALRVFNINVPIVIETFKLVYA